MITVKLPGPSRLAPLPLALLSLALLSLALLPLALLPLVAAAQDPDTTWFPDRDAIELGVQTERAFDRSARAHVDTPLPSGAVLTDHKGTMQNVTVARLTPDGEIETLCTDNREEALDFLAGVDRRGTAARRAAAADLPAQ